MQPRFLFMLLAVISPSITRAQIFGGVSDLSKGMVYDREDLSRTNPTTRRENARQRRSRMRSPGGPRAPRFKEPTAVDSTMKGSRWIKPIMFVLPEYHAIPQYEHIWGKNYTEWSILRRTPRDVGGAITRHPHEDIGYYDFLDYSYRQYMRVMADHFGIYGFSLAHYWHKGSAPLAKAMENILADGEPDKPFFLTWMNEPLTQNRDGSRNNIVIDVDYEDELDNEAHFNYLMKIFLHKNYMTYNGMPILALHQTDQANFKKVYALIELWQDLAMEAGHKGIFIMGYLNEETFNPREMDLYSGFIELEPGFSAVKEKPKGSLLAGWSYDKELTWKKIVDRELPAALNNDYVHTVRGTYWNFNNVPRHFSIAGDFPYSQPSIHVPGDLGGIEKHLLELYAQVGKTSYKRVLGYSVFFSSWNVWNDQTMFEPNDVDGYDALNAIKKVFLSPITADQPRGTILHVARPADLIRRVGDLQKIFPDYSHVFLPIGVAIRESYKYVMVHIHHPGLEVNNENMMKLKKNGIPFYVTVYDYQWLFPPGADLPTATYLSTTKPNSGAILRTVNVLSQADVVLFPSLYIRSIYMSLPGLSEHITDFERFAVVSPPDVMLNHEKIAIPAVAAHIGVGMVGDFTPTEGSEYFTTLTKSFDFVERNSVRIPLKYYVMSRRKGCEAQGSIRTSMSLCSLLNKGTLLGEQPPGPNYLHMLLFLSSYPDPYSYDLTTAVNSGLPIVYLNQGTLRERLSKIKSPRLFPVDDMGQLQEVFTTAIKYTVQYNGYSQGFEKSPNIQPSKWWLSHYPTKRKDKAMH